MEDDRGDRFPFDFEPNRIPFGSNRKVYCHHDHIPFNMKGNRNIVFSVYYIYILMYMYSPLRCVVSKYISFELNKANGIMCKRNSFKGAIKNVPVLWSLQYFRSG